MWRYAPFRNFFITFCVELDHQSLFNVWVGSTIKKAATLMVVLPHEATCSHSDDPSGVLHVLRIVLVHTHTRVTWLFLLNLLIDTVTTFMFSPYLLSHWSTCNGNIVKIVTLALSLAWDFATLRSRYNGGQTGCAIPPPQPSVNVEAQNDEVGTDIDPSTDQFMEHSTSSPRPHSLMEKEITTAVDTSPQLGP